MRTQFKIERSLAGSCTRNFKNGIVGYLNEDLERRKGNFNVDFQSSVMVLLICRKIFSVLGNTHWGWESYLHICELLSTWEGGPGRE